MESWEENYQVITGKDLGTLTDSVISSEAKHFFPFQYNSEIEYFLYCVYVSKSLQSISNETFCRFLSEKVIAKGLKSLSTHVKSGLFF